MRFIAWVWFGMILGVSFLATPAKFQAETLTLPVALEVGRVTFSYFDRLEWLFLIALIVVAWRRSRAGRLDATSRVLLGVIVALVAAHTFYFLPILDTRASMIMAGETPPPSHLHLISGIGEVLQAIALAWLGFRAGDHPPAG
ncbi:MAG: DUF4149 domain-containing protein [Acidobacteriota bacterium]